MTRQYYAAPHAETSTAKKALHELSYKANRHLVLVYFRVTADQLVVAR